MHKRALTRIVVVAITVVLFLSTIATAQNLQLPKRPSQTTPQKPATPVKVPPTKPAGTVTAVTATASPATFTGQCPKTFNFRGTITTSGPAEVKYTWIRSDQAKGAEQTLKFTGAGTKQVTPDTWELSEHYNGWEAIEILSPARKVSNHAAYSLKCGESKPAGNRSTLRPLTRGSSR